MIKLLFTTGIIISVLAITGCSTNSNIDTSDLQTSILHSINTSTANEMIDAQDTTILDVRTPEEFNEGHISDALNIDVNSPTFSEEIAKLDKSGKYLVYCRSGRRSLAAADIMKTQGFTSIYNMEGGYNAWKENN